jgi:hypothetical protein
MHAKPARDSICVLKFLIFFACCRLVLVDLMFGGPETRPALPRESRPRRRRTKKKKAGTVAPSPKLLARIPFSPCTRRRRRPAQAEK